MPILLSAPSTARSWGDPHFVDAELRSIATNRDVEAAWVKAFARYGCDPPKEVQGEFAVGPMDRNGSTFLAVNRFSIQPHCHQQTPDGLRFHPRADVVACINAPIEALAIFHHLYFHPIPAPCTIFPDAKRIPAGHCATLANGRVDTVRWWVPVFEEHLRGPFPAVRKEFRSRLREAVGRQLDGGNVGHLLSGGMDISTVAGRRTKLTGRPAPTFWIRFGATEIEYARIAAHHFTSDYYECYVTPANFAASIPTVAQRYDQQDRNSSVAAAYQCAIIAREAGITWNFGGDVFFGGSSRNAKQRVFDAYGLFPSALRGMVLESVLLEPSPISRLPVALKSASYIEQAPIPMPDRLQIYKLTSRSGPEESLEPEFLGTIWAEEPLRQQREIYAQVGETKPINRTLAIDWRCTLADNEVPKGVGAVSLAGSPVGFSLFHEALPDSSLRLAPNLKLRVSSSIGGFSRKACAGYCPTTPSPRRSTVSGSRLACGRVVIRNFERWRSTPFAAWRRAASSAPTTSTSSSPSNCRTIPATTARWCGC